MTRWHAKHTVNRRCHQYYWIAERREHFCQNELGEGSGTGHDCLKLRAVQQCKCLKLLKVTDSTMRLKHP